MPLKVTQATRHQFQTAFKLRRSLPLILVSLSTAQFASATTYYVSPSGSDTNLGTSSTSPWSSVAKVDSSAFQPGDQILFQYGNTWNASLIASSSGSTSAPIVYGAYGNPSLGNPTFSGSDQISNSSFTLLGGTTYTTTTSTPVNWIYDNHQFTHEAEDGLVNGGSSQSTDPATELAYVENQPGSFYYNSGNGRLYVNPGSTLTNQVITAATRQDAIYSNGYNNLVFQNLNATETAADNGGYNIRLQGSSNVRLLNSTASLGGKHNIGVINTTGFVGVNLVANGSPPDQIFGGASGFVAFSDNNASRPNNQNNTSVWTNITYLNSNGPNGALISHGDPGAIASIVVNNAVSLNGYGTGIDIQSSGPNETALIQGGHLDGGVVDVDTNNSVINGVLLTGSDGAISLNGSHSVVQNTVTNGTQPNLYSGKNGSIIDNGTNNTIRFNVNYGNSQGPFLGILNADSATNIYANIVSIYPQPATTIGQFYSGSGTLASNYNVFSAQSIFFLQPNTSYINYQQWQALGYDLNTITGDPMFSNVSTGDFSLQSGSPALGIYGGTLDPTLSVANSLLGAPYLNGNYSAGLNYNVAPSLSLLSTSLLLINGQTSTVTPSGNALTIQSTGAMVVLSGSTLDMVANVTNAGSYLISGNLIETGNFTNTGSVIINGPQTWAPGSIYTNAAGVTTFQTDVGGSIAPAEYLQVNAIRGTVDFTSTQHLIGLNVSVGATIALMNNSAGRSIIITPEIAVAGTLDLQGNDLIVQGGDVAAITTLIQQGYKNGTWLGTGIVSSTAANDTSHLTALGIILNNGLYGSDDPLGLFDGADPDVNDVLVRYTYFGDTNLDGKVDGSDYTRIDNGFTLQLTGWYNGDFNYDGIVNGSDYTLIDNAFNMQGASLTALTASVTTEVAAVPEPKAFWIAPLIAPLFLSRRRRVQLCHATLQKVS